MNIMDIIRTASVSGFRNNYKNVLEQVIDGPVMLLQSSQVAAVLLSPDEWNRIAKRLKHLEHMELLAEAKRRSAEMDNDPTTVVTHAELKQKLAEKARALHVGTDV